MVNHEAAVVRIAQREAEGGRSMEQRSAAKPGEVDGHRAVVLREAWADPDPVVCAAAEAVDHEQRLAFSPEVEELDGPVQVYSPMPHCVNVTPRGAGLKSSAKGAAHRGWWMPGA